MKTIVLILGLATCLCRADWLTYDEDARVPFLQASIYTRDDYDWWIENTKQPSRLFYYGAYQEQEEGNFDLQMPSVWLVQSSASGVTVAVVDIPGPHSARILDLIQKAAPGVDAELFPVSRYYDEPMSDGISNAVASGARIVVIATGWPSMPPLIGNSISYGIDRNVIFVCSTPNNPGIPDWPVAGHISNLLGVSSVDRNGDLYWSATDDFCVAAPGRNIVADGNYSSGTSYSAAITAGVMALLVAKHPNASATKLVLHVKSTADNLGSFRRFNALNMMLTPLPSGKSH